MRRLTPYMYSLLLQHTFTAIVPCLHTTYLQATKLSTRKATYGGPTEVPGVADVSG